MILNCLIVFLIELDVKMLMRVFKSEPDETIAKSKSYGRNICNGGDKKTTLKVCHLYGGAPCNSQIIDGLVVNRGAVASESMPKSKSPAKILCLDCDIKKLTFVFDENNVYDDYTAVDQQRTVNQSMALIEVLDNFLLEGANVIFCTGHIDDFCKAHLLSGDAIVVDKVQQSDMFNIAAAKKFEHIKFYEAGGLGEAEHVTEQKLMKN